MHTTSKRVAAVCAVGFATLFFVAQTGGAIAPWGPEVANGSASQVHAYLTDNVTALGWSAALSSLMLALLAGFVAASYEAHRDDDASRLPALAMLVGGVITVTLSLAGVALLAAPLSDELTIAPAAVLQDWYRLIAVSGALQVVATFPRALLVGGFARAACAAARWDRGSDGRASHSRAR